MRPEESVSQWIVGVRRGDSLAVQRLWERYFEQLVRLARRKLGDIPRRTADPEDVALSAFASFCHAARAGRFPNLTERDSLWRMLVKFTANKAVDQIRRALSKKAGGGAVRGESALTGRNDSEDDQGMAQVIGDSPTPEFAAMVAEDFGRLMGLLDEDLRAVALAKMEGYTDREIAGKLSIPLSRVERSLRMIRRIWKEASEGDSGDEPSK